MWMGHSFGRLFTVAFLVIFCFFISVCESRLDRKPNVVIFYIDDLGYGDLGCYGHPTIRSPNIDQLAKDGLRLTQFIVAHPICTPSRAALLTGRLPVRFGVANAEYSGSSYNTSSGRTFSLGSSGGIPADETTIAELMHEEGYRTAISGKWHVGTNAVNHTDGTHLPTKHGFDSFFGLPTCNDDFGPELVVYRNDELVEQGCELTWPTLTQRVTAESIRVIEESHADDTPFFLYHSFVHVHIPLYAGSGDEQASKRGFFGDNLMAADMAMGEVMETLERLDLMTDTLIWFASDNGPWLEYKLDGGSTGLLKGGKAQNWEGGIRTPSIIRWDGHIPAGVSTAEVVSNMDILPTIMDVLGVPTQHLNLDGRSVLPLLQQPRSFEWEEPRVLYHYCGTRLQGVRIQPYKVMYFTPRFEDNSFGREMCGVETDLCECDDTHIVWQDPPLMFHVDNDPSERYPLSPDDPVYQQILAQAHTLAVAHNATITPVVNQLNGVPTDPKYHPCCDPPACTSFSCCRDDAGLSVGWGRRGGDDEEKELSTTTTTVRGGGGGGGGGSSGGSGSSSGSGSDTTAAPWALW